MKRILIDVDEVICSTRFLELFNKFKGTNYTIEHFTNFYIEDYLDSEEEKDRFYDFFLEHDQYEGVELIEGAIESIKKLVNDYEVYLCTACILKGREKDSGRAFMDKYNFLVKELPFVNPYNFIFSNKKDIFICDIQIDDRLDKLNGNAELKILFSARHNLSISDEELLNKGVVRANNWVEVLNIINDN